MPYGFPLRSVPLQLCAPQAVGRVLHIGSSMSASTLDSEAAFQARAKELGLKDDVIQKLKEGNISLRLGTWLSLLLTRSGRPMKGLWSRH